MKPKHLAPFKRPTPTVEQLEKEIDREKYKKRYKRVLRSSIYTLIVVAAVAVLVATIWVPVIQIYGSSMSPTLKEGDIVATIKTDEFETGDLICFYIGNKLLVKRYIAGPGQTVNIDEQGNVYVDDTLLNEPYLTAKDLGDCNIELPYQVPEDRIFCLGDQRKTSLDSRHTAVGCISDDQIVGKIFFRVWPLGDMGFIDSQDPIED